MSSGVTARQPSYSSAQQPSYASSSSRANPISLRIYKALGTNFDDPTSLEALRITSAYYTAPSSQDKGKGKSKAVEEPLVAASAETTEADEEEEQSPVFRRTLRNAAINGEGSSAALARKYLKRDVEAELARGSVKFLQAFGEVDKVGYPSPASASNKRCPRHAWMLTSCRSLMSCANTCEKCKSVAIRFKRSWTKPTPVQNTCSSEQTACATRGWC